MFGRDDQQAIERYRYMLRTAPPETIEEAHAEAFAKLTPEQRRAALQQLASAAPPEEVRRAGDDPRSLARLATRTEMRQPGMLERLFGSARMSGGGGFGGLGMGLGGMFAGSLLGSIAGTFIGSAIAESFFHDHAAGLAGGDLAGGEFADLGPETVDANYEDMGDLGGDFGGDVEI